ncbi:MAG: anti-sigma F factor [Bacillota bacterium]|nr:anti-sigma F factor [Bacillota bacterium]
MGVGDHNYLHMEFLSLPANAGVARVAVASFAAQLGFTWAELEEVKVAVSEAVTNAVVHAYPGGRGPVKVRARVDAGELAVEVEDRGVGIVDVTRAREASFTTDPDRMGLGFTFMESFMDKVEVWSEPGRGTRVSLIKRPGREQG